MKNIFFLWLYFLFSLSGCTVINPDTEKKDMQILQLQRQTEQLKTEKEELLTQNEKLASTGSKLLDRLSSLQKRYRDVSEENRDLSDQNQELHQKLYQERIYKQRKFQEELKQDADELEQEAQKLFQNYNRIDSSKKYQEGSTKSEEAFEKELEDLESTKSFEKKEEPAKIKLPEEKASTEKAPILERLAAKRQKLVESKKWTLSDERKLEDIKKVLQSNVPSEEKLKTIQEALEFEKNLEGREVLQFSWSGNMQLSEERKEQLLARHFTLMKLVKYTECTTENFIGFLKNTFLFEKNIETGKEPAYAQSNMFRELFRSEFQLKKVLLSEEWQQAVEYFLVPHNASELLDFLSQIEAGNKICEGNALDLRCKLIQEAFFAEEKNKGKAHYNNSFVHFIFSDEASPWSIQSIDWDVEEKKGEQHVLGQPVLSLSIPNPDGPELYRYLYAITGSEKKAASALMVHSLITEDQALYLIIEEILKKIDLGEENIKAWMEQSPFELKRAYLQWAKENKIKQYLSIEGLTFLGNALAYLEQNQPEGYAYLQKHIESFGFALEEIETPSGYDFSNHVSKENIVRSQARLKYYWPEKNCWETLIPGKCHFSAGTIPLFLQEIERLTFMGELEPREEDFHAVKDLLLYIQLGDKVPKPPMLPIYNSLRRWMETLSQKENYKAIEILCEYAKVFRPHIQIPAIGEKPFSISNREHKLISRLSMDQKPGVIIGIKQAGIIVPGDKMPLCLPGTYWIARQRSQIEHLIEMTSSMALEGEEELKKAWQNLSLEENCEDLLLVLKKLLKDVPSLEENLWQTIQKTISEFNLRGGKDRIFFLPSKKITSQEFKDMESNREFRVKIAHSSKMEEGTIVSQEPGTEYCTVVIASGISPKLLQAIYNLYQLVKQKKGKESKKMEGIRCNLLSFLQESRQSGEIAEILTFCEPYIEESETVKEELQIVKKWMEP